MKTILAACLLSLATAANAQKTYVHITTQSGIQYDIASDTITSMTMDTKAPQAPTTGTAKAKLDGTNEVDVTWVQLWENGPKFAEFNVGATITNYASVTDNTTSVAYATANVGGLYGWGGLTNKSYSDYYSGTEYDTNGNLESNYDVAAQLWGISWRIPTRTEIQALINTDNTELTWCDGSTTQYVSGCTLKGYKICGKTGTAYADNCIFLPAAGYYSVYGGLASQGTYGYYWTSTPQSENSYYLYISTNSKMMMYDARNYCRSVRAVLAE